MKKKLFLLALPLLMLCLNASLLAQQSNKNFPFVKIEGIKYSVISKDTLMKLDSLTSSDNQFKIISFTMTINVGEDIQDDRSSNNLLTPTMKQMISRLNPGDRIWFENIKAKGPDGANRFYEAVALRVEQ